MMLCLNSQLRNNSIFTAFTNAAALLQAVLQAKYESVSERPGRNEESTNRIEERTRNTPSSSLVFTSNETQ